ncbi:MAG: Hsp20/alpha crystallin family protein [Geobacteraceae bacterium]|nr:Hsp20/alpha crystallin family protein [Geobacteraceae bacterium]
MAIVRYNPMRELRGMQEQMNRLLDLAWNREPGEELREGVWQPLVDIFENDEAVVIRAELPGVEQDAIEVKIEGATLTIRGERKQDAEVRKENYHRIERYYGPFQRSFLLPQTIDQEKVNAACDKGVLTITLPKKELIKPKQITVEVK